MASKRPLIGIVLDLAEGRLALKEDYFRAVREAGGMPAGLSPLADPLESAEAVDGVLIPGGGDMEPSFYGETARLIKDPVSIERTRFEIELVKTFVRTGKPVLGICYGMQLVNVALGGTLYQDISEAGINGLHTDGVHPVRLDGCSLFLCATHVVNTSHHQACRGVAPGLFPAAHSEDGLVEAVLLKGHPFFAGVQWHPERMQGDPLAAGIFNRFVKAASV